MLNTTPSKTRPRRLTEHPPFERIALLLQGGGALGSYQAGVYQALAEANLHPDWVAGISIGAINSALIAGNPPETAGRKIARILGNGHHVAVRGSLFASIDITDESPTALSIKFVHWATCSAAHPIFSNHACRRLFPHHHTMPMS